MRRSFVVCPKCKNEKAYNDYDHKIKGKYINCDNCGYDSRIAQQDGIDSSNAVATNGRNEENVVESLQVNELLEKFQLNEQPAVAPVSAQAKDTFKSPKGKKPEEEIKGVEDTRDIKDQNLVGKEVSPDQVEKPEILPTPDAETAGLPGTKESPSSGGGPEGAGGGVGSVGGGGAGEFAQPVAEPETASRQEYSDPAAAEAQIRADYTEEPMTSTALTFSDSLISNPEVYAAVRKQNWEGIYTDSKTFLQQAKIVGSYGNFSPATAKKIVDTFGEGEKFRLAREIRPVVLVTVRDGTANFAVSELKGKFDAKEVLLTTNPGEVKIVY